MRNVLTCQAGSPVCRKNQNEIVQQSRPEEAPALEHVIGLVGRRDMQLLMVGSFAAMFNLYVALTALPLYVIQVGGSVFDAGWLSAVGIFSAVGLRFIFGPMTDIRGRRLPLLFGSAAFLLAPVGYLFAHSVPSIAAVRVFQAIGPAAFLGASSALAIDLSPPSLRATGLGMLSTVKSFGIALAPPIAISVAAVYGFTAVFWMCIFVGACGYICVALLRPQAPVAAPEPSGCRDAARGPDSSSANGDADDVDIQLTYKARWLAVLSPAASKIALTSLAVLTVAYGAVLTFVPLYGEQIGVTHHGVYFTILAVASMIGSVISGALSDRLGRLVVLVPIVVLYGIGAGILLGFSSAGVAAVSATLVGAGFIGSFVILGSLMDDVVPEAHRGLVFAAQENGVDVGMGLGAFMFGAAVDRISYGPGFFLVGLICIGWALFLRSRNNAGQLRFTTEDV